MQNDGITRLVEATLSDIRRIQIENANAAVEVVAARVAKLRLRAPADGIVAVVVAEPGEAIVPGQPVRTLEATGRQWVSPAGLSLLGGHVGGDGRTFKLLPGMSYQVSNDGDAPHRSSTRTGAKLFIVD